MTQHLLNKKNMAKSCKVGVTAFDKWGVEPVERAGREAFYDVASVVRNRIDNELSKIVEQAGDIDDAELLKARIRLTNAQADAQELKNARETGEVIDTEFATYVLAKLAAEIGSIMDSLPLTINRKFPDLEPRFSNAIKIEVNRAVNRASAVGELIPELAEKYIEENQKN
ncbi:MULTISPECIES: terminase small subunit [Enterobacter]|uniref:terminase small subunit n=1 Tax=Enterobacter TaxID=547 RepID=UPI00200454B5|nr:MULTISPECIES: terminase small subunit [Enterobacter]MCK7111056.1 terminase small subunit [Enterobacter kobei]MCK7312795.1 terminase small subunit [Enterobacter bugandensis]MDH0086621.1 terminase small subunit [Enterobacter bugandensis]MDH0111692.1 terminase small subunit [Enterobacter bugandensis]MDH0127856.1 terminase small subunit [Enterobacter bugandensis]